MGRAARTEWIAYNKIDLQGAKANKAKLRRHKNRRIIKYGTMVNYCNGAEKNIYPHCRELETRSMMGNHY